jgi:hypothetical protein
MLALSLGVSSQITGGSAIAAETSLEFVGSASRDVRFVDGTGTATFTVHNASQRSGKPSLRFIAENGEATVDLGRAPASPGRRIALLNPNAAVATLRPGGTRRIALRLRLRSNEAPHDGGGTLQIWLGAPRGAPLVGQLRGLSPDLRFDPSRIMVDVSQGCWLVGGTCGTQATVVIRGRDARSWARKRGAGLGTAVLNNEHGGSVTIRLERPKVRRGTVTAEVAASGLSEAGHYDGSLPVDGAGVAGPALVVEVDVRWSLATAIMAVFAGALFGGFFLRRFEIRRRRRLLELELLSALHRYDEERDRSGVVYSYDLDAVLEPRRHDRAATIPFPGTRGVSALLWHIRTARDDTDFSEDVDRTHALIGNIERWLTLEPVARNATRLLREAIPPRRGSAEFSELQTCRDLARLRIRATVPPESDRVCERLIASLAEQGLLVVQCKLIWALLAELESREGWTVEQARTIHDLDLVALEKGFPPSKDRAAVETDELRILLEETETRLRRLHGDTESAYAARTAVAQAREIRTGLTATKRNPAIDRQLPDVHPWRLRLNAAFNELALRSLFWTLARAFVAVAAYALTIYSDTWGTVTDFASAFTVGFLTETVVNWAVLPAFRSIRNRVPQGDWPAAAVSPGASGGESALSVGSGLQEPRRQGPDSEGHD